MMRGAPSRCSCSPEFMISSQSLPCSTLLNGKQGYFHAFFTLWARAINILHCVEIVQWLCYENPSFRHLSRQQALVPRQSFGQGLQGGFSAISGIKAHVFHMRRYNHYAIRQ